MIDEKVRARAAHAQALIDDELLKESFAAVEDHYLAEWKASKPSETVKREKLWQSMQAIERVKAHLHAVIGNGRIAEANKRKAP